MKTSFWINFGPIPGAFCSKTLKNTPKDLFVPILSLHAKKQKCSMYWLLIMPENSFWASFGSDISKKSYSQRIICIIFNVLCWAITSCKKSEKFQALTFDNTYKSIILDPFWAPCPKTLLRWIWSWHTTNFKLTSNF